MKTDKNINKIGIKEIARLANVSIGTVDRVIHNRGQVAPETRQMVLQIIESSNYTPNIVARTLSSKKETNIAVVIPDSINNFYWSLPLKGIQKAAEEIVHFNFNVHILTFDYSDENSFIQKTNEAIKLNPKGIVFSPLFESASYNFINVCQDKNIPYILLDVSLNNSKHVSYFGQDSVQSGKVAAKLLKTSLNINNPIIFILKPIIKIASTYHSDLRQKGFMEYLQKNIPNVKVCDNIIDISNEENSNNKLKEIFKIHMPHGIFVPNSRVYHIAQWLYNNNYKGIVLIGYDLIEQNAYWMEKEVIDYLICQKPEDQGYKSIMAIFNFLTYKKNIENKYYSPIDIIIKENYKYYINNSI